MMSRPAFREVGPASERRRGERWETVREKDSRGDGEWKEAE